MLASNGYQLFCGCTILGYVLGSSILSNSVLLETTNEVNKRQTLKCNNHCAFGFVPDVEGELTCTCFDPCSKILCLQGATCIAEMPMNCQWESCKPETRCEETREVITSVKKEKQPVWGGQVPDGVQQDGPGWWYEPATGDVCSSALSTAAVDCPHKRRRWYYNPMTGSCDRFLGCPTQGNNFARKRYCKEQCRFRYMKAAEIKAIPIKDDAVCFQHLTNNDVTCVTKSKRWHYNATTGKCEKFTGCSAPGNNFSRKIHCKTKCLKKRTYTTFLKESHSRTTSAR